MTYQSLYRRYRPQRFEDVLGQDHVSATLRNAVRSGKVAHAYLFSGPRGCGKTTSARILAKALNCTDLREGEPCGECASCLSVASGASLDVVELDAASNNGVDAMRDLVARAALGTAGRRKVYIVDEVHMLSAAASNALLKTLEEPPEHVVFVLATTDPQKVLPTIRSRTQHFEFRLFAFPTLLELVRGVARDAGIDLDDAALEAVARKGNGSARDALSALDQVAAAGGIEDSFDITELVAALAARQPEALLGAVDRAMSRGRDPRQLGRDLLEVLREVFLVQMGMERSLADPSLARAMAPASVTRAIESLGEALVSMREALDPRITLEVALVRLVRPDLDPSPAALVERLDRLERLLAGGGPLPVTAPVVAPVAAPPAAESVAAAPAPAPPASAPAPAPAPAPDPSTPVPNLPPPSVGAPGRPGLHAGAVLPSTPAADAGPRGSGVADAARAQLRSVRGTAPSAAPGVGARPAPRRAAPAPAPAAPSDGPVGPPTAESLTAVRLDVAATGAPRLKPLLGPTRFTAFADGVATLTVPNQVTADRCAPLLADFSAALAAHFGAPIEVRLAIDAAPPLPGSAPEPPDDDEPAPPVRREPSRQAPPVVELSDEADIDLAELTDAGDVPETSAIDHLREAFPGAELVDEA